MRLIYTGFGALGNKQRAKVEQALAAIYRSMEKGANAGLFIIALLAALAREGWNNWNRVGYCVAAGRLLLEM